MAEIKVLGEAPVYREKVVVSIEIKTSILAPFNSGGMVLKGLTFSCMPAEAEKLFKIACQAVVRERENDGEHGSTSKKRSRKQAQGPKALGKEGP